MRHLRPATLALLLALTGQACSDGGTEPGRERLELDKRFVVLYRGTTDTLKATVYQRRGAVMATPVIWTSRDESVARVDTLGVVSAERPGRTTVTATAGALAASVDVTVNDDAMAPTLERLTVAPTVLDLSSADPTVTFALTMRDPESGVRSARVIARPPSGLGPLGLFIYCGVSSPVSGTSSEGTWRCSWVLNRYVEPGVWEARVSVTDWSGNWRDSVVTFTVANALPDTTPPVLTGLAYTDETAIIGGNEYRMFAISGSDSESGMYSAEMLLDSATQPGVYSCSFGPSWPSESLEEWRHVHDLTVRCPIPRLPSSPGVVWTIREVRLRDVRGNVRVYGTPELEQAGFVTRIDLSG